MLAVGPAEVEVQVDVGVDRREPLEHAAVLRPRLRLVALAVGPSRRNPGFRGAGRARPRAGRAAPKPASPPGSPRPRGQLALGGRPCPAEQKGRLVQHRPPPRGPPLPPGPRWFASHHPPPPPKAARASSDAARPATRRRRLRSSAARDSARALASSAALRRSCTPAR